VLTVAFLQVAHGTGSLLSAVVLVYTERGASEG
jgi:hypothetical protein